MVVGQYQSIATDNYPGTEVGNHPAHRRFDDVIGGSREQWIVEQGRLFRVDQPGRMDIHDGRSRHGDGAGMRGRVAGGHLAWWCLCGGCVTRVVEESRIEHHQHERKGESGGYALHDKQYWANGFHGAHTSAS